jgi:hypothetical protein
LLLIITVELILLCFLGPSETVRESNFYSDGCFITLFTLCLFVTKRGSNFYFGPGMYFQTGQVIFVPEWPKGEFVSILALFCVWTKSLMCNDAANRDYTFQSKVRRISKFPVSRPDDVCVIPSGRPSVYCSIRLDDVSFRPDIRQTSIICSDDGFLPSGHLHRIEKLLCKLAPSRRFSSTSGRLSVLEQFIDSFQVSRKGRSINRPNDVVSRPDAYLRKARIAVQNEPFEHLKAVVRTLVHRIW